MHTKLVCNVESLIYFQHSLINANRSTGPHIAIRLAMTTWFILGCHVESELDVQEQEVDTGQETGSGFHCREIMASKGLLYATSICPELGDRLNWGPMEHSVYQ